MRVKVTEIYDRLCQCNEAQLAYIEEHMELPEAFLARAAIASRAKQIIELLKQRRDKSWLTAVLGLLDKVQSGTEDYLKGRLEHLKNFLVASPSTFNTAPEFVGTVNNLREQLKKVTEGMKKPLLIRVRGTLFPAALLTAGWWERKQKTSGPNVEWKNPLQQWLFRGFDLWAPSWDLCWGAAVSKREGQRYYIAQLTEGDEADSLPVVIGSEHARRLSDEFRDSWGGFEVVIVGALGHRYQFEKKLPKNLLRDPLDYYICIDDNNPRHRIIRLTAKTDLYSGYLWKLLAPEEWVRGEQVVGLGQVYFVWEHTNFAAKEAVSYNLESLAHKEDLIAKQHPGSNLVLLQKSHAIVPGRPEWSIEKFYEMYLMHGKEL